MDIWFYCHKPARKCPDASFKISSGFMFITLVTVTVLMLWLGVKPVNKRLEKIFFGLILYKQTSEKNVLASRREYPVVSKLFFRFSFCQHKHIWNSSRCLVKNTTFCRSTPEHSWKMSWSFIKSIQWCMKTGAAVLFWPGWDATAVLSTCWYERQQGWRWSNRFTWRHEESRPENIWLLAAPLG